MKPSNPPAHQHPKRLWRPKGRQALLCALSLCVTISLLPAVAFAGVEQKATDDSASDLGNALIAPLFDATADLPAEEGESAVDEPAADELAVQPEPTSADEPVEEGETVSLMPLANVSWYNGHEGDSSYTLQNIDWLAGLAQLVNSGVTDFSGKTIALAAPLDFAGFSIPSIGFDAQHAFNGSFDGGNCCIY